MYKVDFVKDLFVNGNIQINSEVNNKLPLVVNLTSITLNNKIVNKIVDIIIDKIKLLNFDYITGISNGLAYASIISHKMNIPLICFKTHFKKYTFNDSDDKKKVLVIQDIFNNGTTTTKFLKDVINFSSNLVINDIVTIYCNSTKNNKNNLFTLHEIINTHDIVSELYKINFITDSLFTQIYQYLKLDINIDFYKKIKKLILSKGNICYSSNTTNFFELCKEICIVSDNICMLKINSSTIDNFTIEKAIILKKLAIEKNILLLENTLYSYDTNTIEKIINNNKYYYNEWVDILSINNTNTVINDTAKLNYYCFITNPILINSSNNNIIGIMNDTIQNNKMININFNDILINNIKEYSNYDIISVNKIDDMDFIVFNKLLLEYRNNFA